VPTTVRALFEAAGIATSGVVRWGVTIPSSRGGSPDTGVYVVALTDDLDSTDGAVAICPISRNAVQALLDDRPELALDGKRPDVDALIARLTAFWLPDEVVVYIGLAGPRQRTKISALSDRVAEYYSTPLGARSPHAGGWPIKTLATLNDLFVHYAYCDEVAKREQLMLEAFAHGVSEDSRSMLHDKLHAMPFANLTSGAGRKTHGISGARAPRSTKASLVRPSLSSPTPSSASARAFKPASALTQRVTAGDISRGRIRIPRSTKELFPREPTRVDVHLRGEAKNCRWNPRYGPDQERSGVISIGVELMRRLVSEDEQLVVRRDGSVIHLE
jgi:hypothetical protein